MIRPPAEATLTRLIALGATREIFLSWSAERRLLPATDLFRQHVLGRAATGRLPAVTGP